LEDKVGVVLGLNRLGINYFNLGKVDKSVSLHLKNLELSDKENSFASFYNLGICYRSLKDFEKSLQYFRASLEWSRENRVKRLCISLILKQVRI